MSTRPRKAHRSRASLRCAVLRPQLGRATVRCPSRLDDGLGTRLPEGLAFLRRAWAVRVHERKWRRNRRRSGAVLRKGRRPRAVHGPPTRGPGDWKAAPPRAFLWDRSLVDRRSFLIHNLCAPAKVHHAAAFTAACSRRRPSATPCRAPSVAAGTYPARRTSQWCRVRNGLQTRGPRAADSIPVRRHGGAVRWLADRMPGSPSGSYSTGDSQAQRIELALMGTLLRNRTLL